MRLSKEAADFYEQNGYYLFHEPVFSGEKFRALSDIFEALLFFPRFAHDACR